MTGCGNTFRVYHDLDPQADFKQYETYSFLDWTDGNKKTITDLELERIRAGFARELERMGLTYDADHADMEVKITVFFRKAEQPMYQYYGYPYYPPYPYYNEYHYIERALTVDMYDSETQKQIWHSAAVGEVAKTPELRAKHLPKQVEKMLADFPAQKDS